jgi:hypothetical protein
MKEKVWKTAVTTIGLGTLAYKLLRRPHQENLAGQVALITGASRGLGYLVTSATHSWLQAVSAFTFGRWKPTR